MFTGLVEGCGVVTGVFPEGESVRIEIASPLEMSGAGATLDAARLESPATPALRPHSGEAHLRSGEAHTEALSAPESERHSGVPTPSHEVAASELPLSLQQAIASAVRRQLEAAMGNTVRLGDSIAINGCCLTVIAIEGARWSFQAGAETLLKTTLGTLKTGERVNLERALSVGSRFGGHFVLGHVDGVGRVEQVEAREGWADVWFSLPLELAGLLVPKGSIAVDGVSLTVVNCEPARFSVALIPHTLAATTLGERRPGDLVNLEMDVISKQVHQLVAPHLARLGATSTA